ncbi:von Willebrand factor A domain-containing protein 5B2 [Saguinus oedipus]|uniref:von Willebrand factor A domain-containing protein 5B2 n=1 Tax=Saguinus oedipus TaxID=9490 RepID=A0ABQ9U1Z0_SAGOE|nr:von Willebrand factor A domain-containing protein 5B2 [Saguinus oedipus]
MPGLYCPSSWTPLPLTDSWVRACANGPCLSVRARLTYRNPQPQPVDGGAGRADAGRGPTPPPTSSPGVFVYPLAEAEVVSGFEAEAAGRRVSFQLQSRRRSQAACCRALGPGVSPARQHPRYCRPGSAPAPAPARPPPLPRLPPGAALCIHWLIPVFSSPGLGT